MRGWLRSLCLCMLAFASCCPDKTDKLTESVKLWIPYQLGETVHYTDGNSMDSIRIVFYETITKQRTGECGKWYQEEINIQIQGNQINLNVSLNRKGIHFVIPVPPYKFYNHYFETPSDEGLVKHSVYEINNTTYNDVLILTKDSLELYYGRNNGIIGYKINTVLYLKM